MRYLPRLPHPIRSGNSRSLPIHVAILTAAALVSFEASAKWELSSLTADVIAVRGGVLLAASSASHPVPTARDPKRVEVVRDTYWKYQGSVYWCVTFPGYAQCSMAVADSAAPSAKRP